MRNLLSCLDSPGPSSGSSEKSSSNIRLSVKGFTSLVLELRTNLRLQSRPVCTLWARIRLQDEATSSVSRFGMPSDGPTGPIIPHPKRVRTAYRSSPLPKITSFGLTALGQL